VALRSAPEGSGSHLGREASRLLALAKQGSHPADQEIVGLFSRILSRFTGQHGGCGGLLLILDELGKLLEHAALHPQQSDVYLLQQLGEMAARSEQPFFTLGILHQDFSAYANRLSEREQAEWAKIKGRFEDIAFEEPADEILRLLAQARGASRMAADDGPLQPSGSVPKATKEFALLCERAWRLDLAPAGMGKEAFVGLLRKCHPLHPLVAVILGQLFRKLAQNERSVFSFLGSTEPFGLADFLSISTRRDDDIYSADQLYDYMYSAFGESLYAHRTGKRWAEIQSALDRAQDASPKEISLLKTIGLLAAIGQWKNILASKDILEFALAHVSETAEVGRSLATLVRKSIIVHRRYNSSFALWEGSDVDIDEELRLARERLDPGITAARLAEKHANPRPLVARRYSYESGTLRYFTVRFADLADLQNVQTLALHKGDGLIIIALPPNEDVAAQVRALARSEQMHERMELLIVVPSEIRQLDDALREVAAIEWVRTHVEKIEGDATARRELRSRELAAQRELSSRLGDIILPSRTASAPNTWYHRGREKAFVSYRSLNNYLSKVCADLLPGAPRLHNELINRRELSSAAAAARRNLIEAMIEHGDVEDLGVTGTPPQKSIYLSMLEVTGIHRPGPRGWEFGEPRHHAVCDLRSAWETMERFYGSSMEKTRSLSELYAILASPPLGLRDGPIPILLCASLLANSGDVALYEDGSFVPQITVPVFERLIRSPEKFGLHRWRVTGVRATVFQQLATMLGRESIAGAVTKDHILGVVKPLCRFVLKLNGYVRSTERLSATAKNVRTVLSEAREPDQMLFRGLPEACGLPPIPPDADLSVGAQRKFVDTLRAGLGELQRAYDDLLR